MNTLKQFAVVMAAVLAVGTSVNAATNYVWQDSPSPTPPHSSWETAAHVIQDAVDAAVEGDTVLVTNGLYTFGGKVVDGLTNRVAVNEPLTLMSVNGPEVTIIEGDYFSSQPPHLSGIRCVYLADGASLSGFTLTNGHSGPGGGVFCESTNAVVVYCWIVHNVSISGFELGSGLGGGAFGGTLHDCVLWGNVAFGARGILGGDGGGAANSILSNCMLVDNFASPGGDDLLAHGYGGGAYQCTLINCRLTGNGAGEGAGVYDGVLYKCIVSSNSLSFWPGQSGAGISSSTAYNCTLSGNTATRGFGGGAADSTLFNCTLVENSAYTTEWGYGGQGGGAWNSTLNNCILYFNTSTNQPNYDTDSTLNYTCTYPMPTNGVGNITNAPLFVDTNNWADLRLRPDSPCIDAGNNDLVTALMDLDGNPRILNGVVDMGAYEFVPLSPAELVIHLAEMVASSDLRHKRPLLASLEAALASIERGSHYSAMGQLGAFQNKVGAQVYRFDPALAVQLIEGAQEVMDALNDNP